jgi:polyphenol oxidase
MFRQTNQHIPLWHFDMLDRQTKILHYISSRIGGVSQDIYASFNQSFTAGDRKEHVTENRRLLAMELGITPGMLLFPGQTHTANIRVIRKYSAIKERITETDALITRLPEVCVSVLTADCVPLLLYDPETMVVAAAHAGWKGTVQSIALKTVEVMVEQFGCKTHQMLAGIGPSIGPEHYEVGEDVINAVHQNENLHAGTTLKKQSGKKALLSLWEANRQQLLIAGLGKENIELAEICTFESHQTFFSARRLGNPCGRFATGIMIK